jgi:hypothetical protein
MQLEDEPVYVLWLMIVCLFINVNETFIAIFEWYSFRSNYGYLDRFLCLKYLGFYHYFLMRLHYLDEKAIPSFESERTMSEQAY